MKEDCEEVRSCVNREVGLGFRSLSHSSPVPNKPYGGFYGREAPERKDRLAEVSSVPVPV